MIDFTRKTDEYSNVYEGLAADFNISTGLNDGTTPKTIQNVSDDRFQKLMRELEWRRRFSALQEEVGEVEDAINDANFVEARKEIADVAVTLFSMANTLEIDIREYYMDQMDENLTKSPKTTSTGKLTDDSK